MNDIEQALRQELGVEASLDWVDACRSFCQQDAQGTPNMNHVLYQVLHSDLRDIVRPTVEPATASKPSTVAQLESALQQSCETSNQQQPRHLPSDFRLLCQIEEVVDVSLNAESRLSRQYPSGATALNQANGRGSSHRCLKLFLSHGHPVPNNDPSAVPIIGMEVTPISNLAIDTLAGCKILLQGPIVVRWGILQLHGGNATIMGGHIPDLVQAQRKALEQAQQKAGVGVDATIRALIGTASENDPEEPTDEGEGASSDVVMAPPPRPHAPAMAPRTAPQTTPRPPPMNPVLPRQVQAPPNPPPPPAAPSRPAQPRNVPQHPPARSTPIGAPVGNPYTSRAPQPLQQSRTLQPPTTTTLPSSNSPKRNAHSNPYQRSNPTQQQPTAGISTNTVTATVTSTMPTSSSTSSSTPNLSFPELIQWLQQACQNRSLYEQQHSSKRRVQVELIQRGGQMDFNIDKKKVKKTKSSSSKKQYEFVIHATFGSPTGHPQLLSCKLPSQIIEPYFSKTPAELRALSRQDRVLSHQLVTQGGQGVKEAFFGARVWYASLYPPAEQIFGPGNSTSVSLDNVKAPILLLEPAT